MEEKFGNISFESDFKQLDDILPSLDLGSSLSRDGFERPD